MKRIVRDRRLTPEEIAKDKAIIAEIEEELPEILERHRVRMAQLDKLPAIVAQLKAAREAKGLSLADIEREIGMDPSALSKLETGKRPNPTVETLVRYAQAVGKKLVVTLVDA